jgi:hypothetical protein
MGSKGSIDFGDRRPSAENVLVASIVSAAFGRRLAATVWANREKNSGTALRRLRHAEVTEQRVAVRFDARGRDLAVAQPGERML